ncbi:hypothetical protein [Streptomyces cucumeris]|nr:hypothetical protein [Streptomyces sp. NEAU-Y11]
MTELGDLVRPIDCYTTTVTTTDGKEIVVDRLCGNPNCKAGK